MVKELIRNGSFERGNFDFWEVVEGIANIDSGVKKRGNYSAKLMAGALGYVSLRNKDYIEINPYNVYKYTGWFKNATLSKMKVSSIFYDCDRNYISGADILLWEKSGVYDWTFSEGWLVVPVEASYLRLYMIGQGTQNTYGYIDSLSLQEIDLNKIAIYTKELLKKENFTSTGTFYSDMYFSGIWKYGEFYLNVSSLSGTSPTLDVTIQAYDSSTQLWKDIVVFEQATGAGSQLKVATAGLGWKIRVKYKTGGTITDCDFVVGAVFKR